MRQLMLWLNAFALLLLVNVTTARVAEAASRAESSILPSVRSVKPGMSTTAFATLINSGDTTLTGCQPLATNGAVIQSISFSYQAMNASNQPVGPPNTPVSLAPNALQSFVFAVGVSQSAAENSFINPHVVIHCVEATAPDTSGVNDFQVSVGSAAPDIIPIIATPTPGVAEITTLGGAGALALAAVNIGSPGSIVVLPALFGQLLPNITLSICETNSSGACLAPPAANTGGTFATGQTRTYTIFFQQAGSDPSDSGSPFMPDALRLGATFFHLSSGGTIKRGGSSVAYRSPDPGRGPALRDGSYEFVFDDVATRGRSSGTAIYFSALQRFYISISGTAFVPENPDGNPVRVFIDAIASSSPSPTIFSDARVLIARQDLSVGPPVFRYYNDSTLMQDLASAGFKFAGRAVAGSGANPISAAMEADFRSSWHPFSVLTTPKASYPGSYTSTTAGQAFTITIDPTSPGAPMTFSGQAAPKTAGGTACPVSGKLTPVSDTLLTYMAEMTVTTPAGAVCDTSFAAAGTYDGFASLGTQGQALTPSISVSLSPLRRGLRSEVVIPNAATSGGQFLQGFTLLRQ